MDEHQPFGAVLKRFRLAAGLTHEALAARAGPGARTISDLERGVSRTPRNDTLAFLVEALSLSPEQRVVLEAAAHPVASGIADPAHVAANLPIQLTGFVGRDEEARAVQGMLRRHDIRLVTLTGAGGVGKTRLAYHIAARSRAAFADGVFAAALAPVVDRSGAVQAIDQAIGGDGRRPLPVLAASLADKDLLLVLDNCEHLPATPGLVAELLRGGLRLKILATSRARLRVSGEQEFPVAPLPVPDVARLPPVSDLHDYAVIALFVDRATRARPDFALDSGNAAAVVGICARLDGLPLALELAAARVKVLPPRILLERLGDAVGGGSLRLLADGAHDLPARQQTLRNTIAWSHGLLASVEQTYFRRLAVFYGGYTLEAAEAILDRPIDRRNGSENDFSHLPVLDGLASLLEKSLLVREDGPDGEPRFVMLETIREYAWEQLTAAGEAVALRGQHAAYYLALVEATGGLLFAAPRTRARAAAEQGNIQAALRWLVEPG